MLPNKFRPVHRLFLFLNDLIGINLAFLISHTLWMTIKFRTMSLTPMYLQLWLFINILWLPLFCLFGMYRERNIKNFFEEIRVTTGAVSLGIMLLTFTIFFIRFLPTPEIFYSRAVILILWILSAALLLTGRGAIHYAIRFLKQNGRLRIPTVVAGSAPECARFMTKLFQSAQKDYNVLGCVIPDAFNGRQAGSLSHQPAPHLNVIGNFNELNRVVRENQVEMVIIAESALHPSQIMRFIAECREIGVEFRILQNHLDVLKTVTSLTDIADIPTVAIKDTPIRGFNRILKRAIDATVAFSLLVILFPLFLVIILIIRLDSPGPVTFRQARVGKKGKQFHMFKFRTMRVHAELEKEELEPIGRGTNHLFKLSEDPRITRFGRFLRRWSIDELPQLINVLFGEISLVGPRPLIPQEADGYEEWHRKRLEVTPGITGLWQTSGRSELDFDDMVRLDIYYIENWSLWLDLEIIARTIPAVISRRGAY